MKVLGIDPGLSGALAMWIDGRIVDCIDMPVTDETKRVNARVMMPWVLGHAPEAAIIELVNAMPSIPDPDDPEATRRTMGAQSAFRFGDACGSVRTVVVCCGVPWKYVVSRVWKRAVGLVKGSDKEASRQLALEKFPEAAHFFKRKKDENRAEAALIASYGAAILTKQQEIEEPRLL